MTLALIDATLSDQRRNADKADVIRAMRLLKSSEEFYRFVNATTAVGLSHLGIDPVVNVGPMLEFVENAMALAMDVGYRIAKQESGVKELEEFFS